MLVFLSIELEKRALELKGQIKMEEMCFSRFLKTAKDSAARVYLKHILFISTITEILLLTLMND